MTEAARDKRRRRQRQVRALDAYEGANDCAIEISLDPDAVPPGVVVSVHVLAACGLACRIDGPCQWCDRIITDGQGRPLHTIQPGSA